MHRNFENWIRSDWDNWSLSWQNLSVKIWQAAKSAIKIILSISTFCAANWSTPDQLVVNFVFWKDLIFTEYNPLLTK